MYYDDSVSENGKSIADLFSTFFESAYFDYPSLGCHFSDADPIIDNLVISPEDINLAIKNTQSKMSIGSDNLPACVIKNCLSSLMSPLLTLFNPSLQKGYFPKHWIRSYITPIYKEDGK